MDYMCDKKFVKRAQNLIKKFNIVINNEEHEILTTSIHINSFRYPDPFVQTKGRNGNTWFPYSKEHLKYVDFDLSAEDSIGGIRINTVKSLKTNKIVPTAGDVYKYIENKIGRKEFKKIKGKAPTRKSSPLLYLKKRKNENTREVISLPRYAQFKTVNGSIENALRYCVVTHMFTCDLSWLPEKVTYPQMAMIILYLFVLGKHKEVLERKIIMNSTLEKYLRYALKTSQKSPGAIYQDCGVNGIGIKQACELFGYYTSHFHDFSKV